MAESGWNFAEVWESIADQIPDAPAQRYDGQMWTWREFDQRADAIASFLLARGVAEQDKVAQYLYNGPHYLESVFASFKAGLAVVNTNYRYTPDELTYLWDNADVVAVVFHGTFVEQCTVVRDRLAGIETWVWVDDGSGPCPDWAVPYEDIVAAAAPGRAVATWGRSGDHLLLMYTGGTTGMPKGVMWRQDDLYRILQQSAKRRSAPEDVRPDAPGVVRIDKPGPLGLPGAPLMHGTGQFNALTTLSTGGSIVTMPGRKFDPVELLDTVEQERVKSITIVGDAFAKPILRALDAEPDRWDISSLRVVLSSGVMWSKETKDGLLRHNPRLILVDALGSSEAIGMAQSTTTSDGSAESATFVLSAGHAGHHGSGSRRVLGLRRARHRGDERSDAPRVLQGPREVGRDLPHHRRRPLHDPGRLRLRRRRRHGPPPRPRQSVHQHRGREGLPGRGRGGAEAPSGGRSTPPSSACPTSASGKRSRPWSSRQQEPGSTRPS